MRFAPLFLGSLGLAALVGCSELGNDTGPYANDGECDDPRYTGQGMASSLNDESIGRDASDCAAMLAAGRIRPIRQRSQWEPAQCRAISFGDNSSQWARDGECDDPRFAGPGVDEVLLPADKGHDAADCRALCEAGEAWPR